MYQVITISSLKVGSFHKKSYTLLPSSPGVQEKDEKKHEEKEETPMDQKEVWFVPSFRIIVRYIK